MKLRIKKSELRECIENAVIMALNEAQQKQLKEGYYDDDDDSADAEMSRLVDQFTKNPKNRYKRKDPKAAEARAQAMKDIKAETDAEKRDDKAAKDAEDREMKKDVDESADEGAVQKFFNRTFNGKNVRANANKIQQLVNKYQNDFLNAKSNMTQQVQNLYTTYLGYLKKYQQRAANGENVPDKQVQSVTKDLDKWLGRATPKATTTSQQTQATSQSQSSGSKLPYNSGGMGKAYQTWGIPDDVAYGQRG